MISNSFALLAARIAEINTIADFERLLTEHYVAQARFAADRAFIRIPPQDENEEFEDDQDDPVHDDGIHLIQFIRDTASKLTIGPAMTDRIVAASMKCYLDRIIELNINSQNGGRQ